MSKIPCSAWFSSRSARLLPDASSFLASIARGGLQFMLIIWLQGIWLPLHGYNYDVTPLWAGIYLLPLLIGFVVMGPLSGWLSDRFGARLFSTTGMLIQATGFLLLTTLPTNFNYPWFALLLFMLGLGQGMFSSPNTSSVMNSVPAEQRGAASGMRSTFQNSGTLVSIGVFLPRCVSSPPWRLFCEGSAISMSKRQAKRGHVQQRSKRKKEPLNNPKPLR